VAAVTPADRLGLVVLNAKLWPQQLLDLARRDPRVRVYRPISEKIRAGA